MNDFALVHRFIPQSTKQNQEVASNPLKMRSFEHTEVNMLFQKNEVFF